MVINRHTHHRLDRPTHLSLSLSLSVSLRMCVLASLYFCLCICSSVTALCVYSVSVTACSSPCMCASYRDMKNVITSNVVECQTFFGRVLQKKESRERMGSRVDGWTGGGRNGSGNYKMSSSTLPDDIRLSGQNAEARSHSRRSKTQNGDSSVQVIL